MPDFDAMTEPELKAFRLAKNAEMRAIRDEIRIAGRALERLRAAQDSAEYARVLAEYGSDAVSAASKIITSPPASANGRAPQIGA